CITPYLRCVIRHCPVSYRHLRPVARKCNLFLGSLSGGAAPGDGGTDARANNARTIGLMVSSAPKSWRRRNASPRPVLVIVARERAFRCIRCTQVLRLLATH